MITHARPQDEDIKFGTFDFSGGKPVPTYLAKKKPKMTLQQTLKKVRCVYSTGRA